MMWSACKSIISVHDCKFPSRLTLDLAGRMNIDLELEYLHLAGKIDD
jgi:hypothetical protein